MNEEMGEQECIPQKQRRCFELFTHDEQPVIDAMAIIGKLLREMTENERVATLQYFADLHGYRIYRK